MTPAVKQCQKYKVPFTLHQYNHDVGVVSYGLEAAEKLAIDSKFIYKTLVIETETKSLAVAIIPVTRQLNLKSIAKVLKCKKVSMADPKRVQTTTGYVLGGVSPLGQKRLLPTIIDSNCQLLSSVYISGGKRGLEIELSSEDLASLTRAKFSEISKG